MHSARSAQSRKVHSGHSQTTNRPANTAPAGMPKLRLQSRPVAHKPSLLKALSNPAKYKQQLGEYKAQRQEVLYQELLRELGEKIKFNPKRIARVLDKLMDWGELWAIGRYMEVPAEHDRPARLAQYAGGIRGIDAVLADLKPYQQGPMRLLGVRILQACGRIEEVNHYEKQVAPTAPGGSSPSRMGLTPRPASTRGSAEALPDDDGEPWTLIDSGSEPPTLDADERHWTKLEDTQADPLWNFSNEGSGGAVLISEGPDPHTARARRPTLFAGKRKSDQVALEARRELKKPPLKAVIKASGGEGQNEKAAMRLFGVLDSVMRTAPKAPAFRFGQHSLFKPDPASRQELAERIATAHTKPHRQGKRQQFSEAIRGGSPVLEQKALAGQVVRDASLTTRFGMWKDRKLVERIGAGLVQTAVLGLGDHNAPDGAGLNSWSNWLLSPMGPEGRQLIAIDLSERPHGLSAEVLETYEKLAKCCHRIARRLGPQGELPSNWHKLVQPLLGDFLTTTFTVGEELFPARDFLTPDEQKLIEPIDTMSAQAAALREKTPFTKDDEREAQRLEAAVRATWEEHRPMLDAAAKRGNEKLAGIMEAAMPYLLKGIVKGLSWIVECNDALIEAHEAAYAQHQAQSGEAASTQNPAPKGYTAENLQKLRDTVRQTLKPADYAAFNRLKPNTPTAQAIKV